MAQSPEPYDLPPEPAAAPAREASPVVEDTNVPENPLEPRRGFLRKATAITIGGVATLVPAAAGLIVFTDPLRRKKGAATFVSVAPLDAIPADGAPRKFQLVVERVDAWNKSRDVASVYLLREKESDQVKCFSVTCPHAGCAVDWSAPSTQGAEGTFKCPCHNSSFKKDGSLVPGSVSPRGLDELEVDPEALKQGQIAVKYQEFMAGTHNKIAKT